jgi:hypothetical protein
VSAPAVTALPDPAIPPEDVQAIMPGLTPEQATLAAQLATVAVEAALHPNPIPDPTPAPVYAVLMQASVRFGSAIEQGGALPVVSESLGSYSYRLANPATLPGAFGLSEDQLEQLAPWSGRSDAYELYLRGSYTWPADYWQRDYDRLAGPPEEEA